MIIDSNMEIEKIIDEAYSLYMPQDRYEITELTTFIYDHLKCCQYPPNILEIGTKYGGTFYIWNKILDALRDEVSGMEPMVQVDRGMCISIDFGDGGRHGGISEQEMDKRDLWFEERFDNVYFIRGDSHSASTRTKFTKLFDIVVVKPLPEIIGKCIDVLFIDGDHTYEGVKQDFLDYEPFCKKESIICFHDINDSPRHRERNVFVSEFWKELKENENGGVTEYNGNYYKVMEFNAGQDWAGIGILIKK